MGLTGMRTAFVVLIGRSFYQKVIYHANIKNAYLFLYNLTIFTFLRACMVILTRPIYKGYSKENEEPRATPQNPLEEKPRGLQ